MKLHNTLDMRRQLDADFEVRLWRLFWRQYSPIFRVLTVMSA